MTRTLRSRSLPLAIAAASVGLAAGATAAGATDVQVHGPSHPKVQKRFTIRADGDTSKRRVLQVTIHLHGKCSRTYGGEKATKQYIAFARFVGPGNFDETRSGLYFKGKTNGHYCAYLGDPNDLQIDPPVDRDSKHFQVVEPSKRR